MAHSYCIKNQSFLPSKAHIIFHSTDKLQFVLPLSIPCPCSLTVNNSVMNMDVQISLQDLTLLSVADKPRSVIASSYFASMFNF